MLQSGIGFNRAQIWAVDVRQGIIALGCSDGSIEVGNTAFARVLGRYQNNNDAGIVQIKLKANKVIVGRLNGLLELVGLQFTESADHPLRFTSLATVKAHQRPCTGLECTGLYLFSSGYDRLVKIFDIRTMRPLHTLIRDESPVLELKIDEQVDSPLVLYNRYESGLICSWDVESGEYLHSFTDLQSNGITRAELALTSTALVAFSEDGQLFIWNKFTSDFIIRLVAEETFINESTIFELTRGRILSLGDNNTVVTSIGTCVQFWDVEFKALIRQVELPTSIETLLIIEGKAILCVSTNTIYRIDLPLGSLRNRIPQ
uniref:Uncharacterized protein n=1 Tax=Panagrolaimus davidi TaxID=227884 RepID=A0A914PFR2_9BILA